MKKPTQTVIGRVVTWIQYRLSHKGVGYSQFVVKPETGEAIACIAFDADPIELAKDLSEKVKEGDDIICYGALSADKQSFIVRGFEGQGKKKVKAGYQPPVRKPDELDHIMDILTPAYVTKRYRDWAYNQMGVSDQSTFISQIVKKLIIGKMNWKDYPRFFEELRAEAKAVESFSAQ